VVTTSPVSPRSLDTGDLGCVGRSAAERSGNYSAGPARAACAFAVAVDIGGTPVVANENPNTSVQRVEVSWVGAMTLTRSYPVNPIGMGTSSAPLIALDSLDLPVLAWTEGDPSVFEGPDGSRIIRAARLVPNPAGPDG
jgi:hypothetical protein